MAISITSTMALSSAVSLLAGKPSSSTTPGMFRQAISNSFIVYGKRRVGGLLCFFYPAGKKFRYFVIAAAGHHCKGVVRWYLNDDVVTVDASSGLVLTGSYANNAWLWFYPGTEDQAAHPTFVAECGGKWTVNHRLRGVACIYAKFKMTNDVVQAGMPNVTAEIEGKDDIVDPRTGTAGYTRNAALVIDDWMKMAREEGGFGGYADEFDDDWTATQAQRCDEDVPVAGVRTTLTAAGAIGDTTIHIDSAAGLAAGVVVSIGNTSGSYEQRTVDSVSGTAAHLTHGLVNAYANGTAVTWAVSGGVTVTEKRYELDSYITTGASPSEVRDGLVQCCAGSYTYSGGKHLVRPGYYVPPTASLAEEDLAGAFTVPALLPGDQICTEVAGTYVDPTNLYQPKDVPTRAVIAADVIQKTVDLPHITSGSRGQRICEIILRKTLAERRVTWPMNIAGIAISTLQTVQCATTRYGLSNYAFQVVGWTLAQDFSVQLALEEHNSDIYDWDVAMEIIPALTSTLTHVDPTALPDAPEPGSWAAAGASYPPSITVTGAADDDSATGIVIEYRLHGSTNWTSLPIFAADTGKIEITGLAANTSYDVGVSYADAVGTGDRLEIDAVVTGAATSNTPDAPVVGASNGTGSNVVTVRAPQTKFDHIDLLRGSTNNPATMTVIDAGLIIGLGATYSDTYSTTAGTWWYSAIAYAADGTASTPATPVSAVIS